MVEGLKNGEHNMKTLIYKLNESLLDDEVNNFYCYDCVSLSSLKGLPKKISGDLECNGCYKLTIKEFEKYLPNIGGDLYCDSDINKQLNYKDFNFKVGGDIYSN